MGMFFGHNQIFASPNNGYLYNGYALRDSNFAPTDWKVPVFGEYNTLISSAGGETVAGGRLKTRDTNYWNSQNYSDPDSGFEAYASGFRNTAGFFDIKNVGYYGTNSFSVTPVFDINDDSIAVELLTSAGVSNIIGLSARLLYTGGGTPTTVTDYDGNVYDVVLIGSQYWTVQNWKCTKLNNGNDIPLVEDQSAWNNLTTLGRCAYDNNEANV
jgi:hypothetical protein